MSSVLVTGGTGFVGRHLARELGRQGQRVDVVVRAGSTRVADLGPSAVRHELSLPSLEVGEVITATEPSVVFHLATHFTAKHEPSEISAMLDSNVTYGTAVAQACADSGARLVHVTSAWQHLGGAAYEPVSLYAATKQALVDIVRYFEIAEGLDAREVCLFDTYGSDDDRGKLVSALMTNAGSGRVMQMSSGRQLVDLTHIDDIVAALINAGGQESWDERLVARSNRPVTIRELVAEVERATGLNLDVEWDARPDRPREMVENWVVASGDYGWSPRINLSQGLSQVWNELESSR